MMGARHIIFRLAFLGLAIGCRREPAPDGGNEKAPAVRAANERRSAIRPAPAGGALDDALTQVRRAGYIADSGVLGRAEGFVITAASARRAEERALFIFRRDNDTAVHVGTLPHPLEAPPPNRFQVVGPPRRWESVLIAYEYPTEGIVGASLLRISETSLQERFRDRAEACRAADVRDIDGDGKPELIEYVSAIDEGDCSTTCSLLLRDDLKVEPSWPVLRDPIVGSELSPRPAWRDFYRLQMRSYEQAITFVDSQKDICEMQGTFYIERLRQLRDSAAALVLELEP